ncbi:MAG: phenylalanine--tRNA ligase subunit alpha, partial [Burkholderiales bacterium]|nr:phenylalanine--tRNA ligase subunit alpha [Burkholderiales bacterium]
MEQQKLDLVLDQGLAELSNTTTIHDLDQVKARYIGKSGQISVFMQQIKNIAPELRKDFGAQV